jgi:hypothetical protein
MKNSVKCILAGMFLMFLIGGTYAQTVTTTQVTTVEQKTASTLDEISKIVTLTPEQTTNVTPYLTQFFKQKELDQQQYKDQPETQLVAAQKRRETLVENMKTVLTGEQMDLLIKKWEKFSTKSTKTETQITE